MTAGISRFDSMKYQTRCGTMKRKMGRQTVSSHNVALIMLIFLHLLANFLWCAQVRFLGEVSVVGATLVSRLLQFSTAVNK